MKQLKDKEYEEFQQYLYPESVKLIFGTKLIRPVTTGLEGR